MVFKAVSGVAARTGTIWSAETTKNEEESSAIDTTDFFKDHYKNRIATPKNWAVFKPRLVSTLSCCGQLGLIGEGL